ncbi:MAG TPA: hypothetical protein PKC99_06010 [Anaerolineales bacterium]|nr:hypothetical protein [Anaerolineales bacterium]
MNLPVASCLVCGQEKELAVWVDPAITGGSFHGVCFQCRQAAQHGVEADVALLCDCGELFPESGECKFCGAVANPPRH